MSGNALNFPVGPFVDLTTGQITQQWRLWLLNQDVLSINLANALPTTSGGTGADITPAAGQVLVGTNAGVFTLTNNLPASSGGTGNKTYAVGDILYADTATTLARLPAGTAGDTLTSNGPGAAPSYEPGGFGSIPTGEVVSNISGAPNPPIGNALSDVLDAVFGSGRGEIITRTASGWSALGPSTGGNVLTENGPSADVTWSPSARLSSIGGIDGKTIAATTLYTSPVGKTATVTGAVVHVSASSAITIGAHADIYTTTPGDICASQAMTLLTASPTTFTFIVLGTSVDVPAGGTVKFNLSTAATGTSQTLRVDLLGYLT